MVKLSTTQKLASVSFGRTVKPETLLPLGIDVYSPEFAPYFVVRAGDVYPTKKFIDTVKAYREQRKQNWSRLGMGS